MNVLVVPVSLCSSGSQIAHGNVEKIGGFGEDKKMLELPGRHAILTGALNAAVLHQ